MIKKYIAIGSVGHFLPGEEIKGLDAERIQALLASGAIAEAKEPEQVRANSSASEIAELKDKLAKAERDAKEANIKVVALEKENADLKAEIAELQKVPKTTADATTPTEATTAPAKGAKAK